MRTSTSGTRKWVRLSLAFVIVFCALPSAFADRDSERRNRECLSLLSELFGKPISAASFEEENASGAKFSGLAGAKRRLDKFGFPTRIDSLSVTELQALARPVLIQTDSPERFTMVAALGMNSAVISDGIDDRIISITDLTAMYRGQALYLSKSPQSRVSVAVQNPVRIIKITSMQDVIREEFIIRNVGREPLKIAIARDSCGCYGTRPTLSADTIAPGGAATLKIAVQPRNWGNQMAAVTVKTSDPNQPMFVAALQASAAANTIPSPTSLTLDSTEGGEQRQSVTLLTPGNVIVSKAFAKNDFVKVAFAEEIPKDQGRLLRYEVVAPKDAPPGEYKDELVFELKGAEIPRVVIPVWGEVASDIGFDPPKLFFGRITPGTKIHRSITLRSKRGNPFEVKLVKSLSPDIMVRLNNDTVKGSYELNIEMTVSGEVGDFYEKSIIVTLDKGRRIYLPVSGLLVNAADASNPSSDE